jgi:hypothetical protein
VKSVLVDTSVWVRHFRESDLELSALLAQDRVWVHPFIIGEIACGTPPNRNQTIADLQDLQQVEQASLRETMQLIENKHLFGLGCGLTDLFLLASTLMTTDACLWTLDKRLSALAERFEVCYSPALH